MTNTLTKTGSCLCGKVTFTTATLNPVVSVCHCDMCKKWTGGPALALEAGASLSFTGEEHIGRYRSSEWGERGFCTGCGGHLFFLYLTENLYFIQMGTLDNLDGLTLESQIFIDHKPDFYSFAEQTQNLTEAEFLAMLS